MDALTVLPNPRDRTFCEMLCHTGCRPSEALALTAMNIDTDEGMIIIASLKQRGARQGQTHRAVPVPRAFISRLDEIHQIRKLQARPDFGRVHKLWRMSRTTAWKRVQAVMQASGITGQRACARGLRHAYGVNAALTQVPESCIQRWLGHAKPETSAIYLDMSGPEDRAVAQRMWQ